jgi:hypothetical protein
LCCDGIQVGFLISLDKRQHAHDEATNTFPNIPEDFEFVFLQDDDAFFKSDEMNQLDEEIGDLDAFIKDTEALIVSFVAHSAPWPIWIASFPSRVVLPILILSGLK